MNGIPNRKYDPEVDTKLDFTVTICDTKIGNNRKIETLVPESSDPSSTIPWLLFERKKGKRQIDRQTDRDRQTDIEREKHWINGRTNMTRQCHRTVSINHSWTAVDLFLIPPAGLGSQLSPSAYDTHVSNTDPRSKQTARKVPEVRVALPATTIAQLTYSIVCAAFR